MRTNAHSDHSLVTWSVSTLAHITTMAQRAFTLLKLIPYSPKYVPKRAHAPNVKGFPPDTLERIRNEDTKRQSPSHMRLYSLGDCIGKHRFGRSSSQESNSSLRSGPPSPHMQAAPPSPPPATTRPVPIKVQLPVQASWLHDHWKPAQVEGQVRARIALFEGLASAPTSPASSRPSSPVTTRTVTPPPTEQAAVQRKVKRRAPPPPVSQAPSVTPPQKARSFGKSKPAPPVPVQTQTPVKTAAPLRTQTPLIAPSLVKTVARMMPAVRRDPIAQAPVSTPPKPPVPPAPPAPPKTETSADVPGASSAPQLLRPHSEPGRSALFAELLNNPMVEKLRRQESSPAALATEGTAAGNETDAPSKAENRERRSSPVYLKGADIYPFHNQLQVKLGNRAEAKAHVPSPEALRQAEELREKRAQGQQSHGFSGPWKPSEADRSLQQELKVVLDKMGESSA